MLLAYSACLYVLAEFKEERKRGAGKGIGDTGMEQ